MKNDFALPSPPLAAGSRLNVASSYVGSVSLRRPFTWELKATSRGPQNRPAARRSLTLQSFSDGALWAAGRAGEGKRETESAAEPRGLEPDATFWRPFQGRDPPETVT